MQDLNTAAAKSQPSLCILGSYKTLAFLSLITVYTYLYSLYTHTLTYRKPSAVELW